MEALEAELHQLEQQQLVAAKEFEAKISSLKDQIHQAKQASLAVAEESQEISTNEYVEPESQQDDLNEREGEEIFVEDTVDSKEKEDDTPLGPGEAMESVYGQPLTPEQAAAIVPATDEGLIWHATIVPDNYAKPKETEGPGKILARRPEPTATKTEFFSSLVETADHRWIFHGVLNGWPALTNFELKSMTVLVRNFVGQKTVKRTWAAGCGKPPTFPDKAKAMKVTLRAPAWTFYGWTPNSTGFVWWFQQFVPRFLFGENILRAFHEEGKIPNATRVHAFAHRYSRGPKPETRKDKITYHTGLLMEWDHGKYCTVIELATFNGVGGRYGKVNWMHDKLKKRTLLYQHFPAEMVGPWKADNAEIRCTDVEAKSKQEFEAYLAQYTGPQHRFLVPEVFRSEEVRLSHRSQADIATYLLNYSNRDRRYAEEFRNCQTFVADFFSFLTGKKDSEPFHASIRVLYKPRQHLFLYDASMYKFANSKVLHK